MFRTQPRLQRASNRRSNRPALRPRLWLRALEDRVVPTAPPAPAGYVASLTTVNNLTPEAILDSTAVSSTILVAGAGSYIHDVDLTTFIAHTFAGDLDITLTSPAGTVVTISTDNGGGANDVFNGTLWDDDADPGNPVPYVSPLAASKLVTDTAYTNLTVETQLTPEEPLAAFIGTARMPIREKVLR